MTGVEGPVVGWLLSKLGPIRTWFKDQFRADHVPITGRRGRPDQTYGGFFLFAAAAPSQSPKLLPLADFADRAHDLVQHAFPSIFPEVSDYAGHELVRYRSSAERSAEQHIITIYPTGLVELQWLIAAPPATSLPLSGIVEPLQALRQVVQASGLADLYQPRRFEGKRRVDWRIGINGMATSNLSGTSVSWTNVTSSIQLPEQRNRTPRPYCPAEGYAPHLLTSLRLNATLEGLLMPVLEEHLVVGGYVDSGVIRDCITELANSATELDEQADREALT